MCMSEWAPVCGGGRRVGGGHGDGMLRFLHPGRTGLGS